MDAAGVTLPAEPLCRYVPDDWFAHDTSAVTAGAVATCRVCPLLWECRQLALDEGIPYGVYGGMTAGDRRRWWALHGGRPTVFDDRLRAMTDSAQEDRRAFESFDIRHRAVAADDTTREEAS